MGSFTVPVSLATYRGTQAGSVSCGRQAGEQSGDTFSAESCRHRILRYLRAHPELDDPQIVGELRFVISRRLETGRTDVAATFFAQGVDSSLGR